MCGRTYVILYFDPHVLALHTTLSQTALNRILWFLVIITRIILEIELFTALNSFT